MLIMMYDLMSLHHFVYLSCGITAYFNSQYFVNNVGNKIIKYSYGPVVTIVYSNVLF